MKCHEGMNPKAFFLSPFFFFVSFVVENNKKRFCVMRILILSQWFQPEPFYKGVPFAQELVKLGHEVEVLTGFPNYPGGKVYDGYKIKFFQREMID